jgi:hypothetical protein
MYGPAPYKDKNHMPTTRAILIKNQNNLHYDFMSNHARSCRNNNYFCLLLNGLARAAHALLHAKPQIFVMANAMFVWIISHQPAILFS